MKMESGLETIQKIFLKANACGWSGAQKTKAQGEFTGLKEIPFVLGNFRVIDRYIVTPYSNMSSGTTTIWVKNEPFWGWVEDGPVWVMHYGGWYKKEVIPFLKSCLQKAYVGEQRFYGGRGPFLVREEKFTYVNQIERNDFADFAGEERIFDLNDQCLGYHWYRGMSLFGNNFKKFYF